MPNKKIYIRYFATTNDAPIKKLMATVEQKLREDIKEFTILMSCPGGSVFHGISAYNFLRGIPAKVITHNFGHIISMGVGLFCAGDKRLSVPHGTFLIHGVQANFPQRASLEEKQLEERLKSLRLDEENIAGIIADNTDKKESEIMKAMRSRTALNPEKALEFGLIQKIEVALFEKGAEIIDIVDPAPK